MKKVVIDYDKKIFINSERLKRLRLKKCSQKELGKKIKQSKETISLIERGKNSNPHIGTIFKIATFLDCSIDYLCNRDKYHHHHFELILKKGLDFYLNILMNNKLLSEAVEIFDHSDDQTNNMRRDIIYKILTSDDVTIQSLHHLFCE